ncbi:MAG: hypothetical protein IPP63_19795 [Chloracidobacterium sp.]|nr:hypothetical protein [Chloracidobacterium sp.]
MVTEATTAADMAHKFNKRIKTAITEATVTEWIDTATTTAITVAASSEIYLATNSLPTPQGVRKVISGLFLLGRTIAGS